MRWSEIEAQQPDLIKVGMAKFGPGGLVLVGTIRRDGSPRVSPVNAHFWEGDLCMSMASISRKVQDLLRDSRILVHNAPTRRDGADGEYKVRGRAVLEEDTAAQARFSQALKDRYGWGPEVGTIHLFRIDVDNITYINRENSIDYLNPDITRWP
jgi:hypothetical protein